MIDINLVPQHLRKRRKIPFLKASSIAIPQEAMLGLAWGLLAILFVTHVLLQFVIFSKLFQHQNLSREWQKILPEKKIVDGVLSELKALQSKINSVEKVATGKRIFWAEKLNSISDVIPRGVWLNKISLDQKILLIDGSAVSRMKEEMSSVGNFASNLKNQKNFMRGLGNIEVGAIQKRKIQSVELADFLITVKLK